MRGLLSFAVAIVLMLSTLTGRCQTWDTIGCSLRDTLPTRPCGLGVASVDSLLNRIVVHWSPSPDSDIAGYYLCSGTPCLCLDTIWGPRDTFYICNELLPQEQHQFRVLAFDSCFNASPLTQRFGNLVLQARHVGCPSHIDVTWQGCDTIPGGLGGFRLLASIDDAPESIKATLPSSEHQYSFAIAEGTERVALRVAILTPEGVETAWSNQVVLPIPFFDSTWRLSIRQAYYDETLSAVCLQFETQEGFAGEYFNLYRGANGRTPMFLERFEFPMEEVWDYHDASFEAIDTLLRYYLERLDSCGNSRQLSNVKDVRVPIPEPPEAFFPNIFTPQRENNNLFKGVYVSIEAEDYDLRIFNRMGLQVFATKDIEEAWDGTCQGIPLPTGTYVYHLCCKKIGGGFTHFKGTVFLLR